MRKAKPFLLVALGLLLAVLLIPSSGMVARGELIRNHDLNYELETPPRWARLPELETWKEFGIVVGATRELAKLKDGSPGKGEGGLLHLGITDMPEGKTLEDMSKDEATRGFLMRRFDKDSAKWPDIEVVRDEYGSGLEIFILTAKGEAPNLKSKKAPVRAVLMIATAKKKLFKLRMYAWYTEFDAEGLKGDLDVVETQGFDILDLRPDAEKPTEGERPPEEDEPEEGPTGDEAEEKVIEDKLVGWKLVKPVGLKSKTDYDKEKFKDVVAWFEDNDHVGSYQLMFYVIKRGRKNPETGQPMQDEGLRNWGLDRWWATFDRSHPTGVVRSWAWPRKSSFLTLPDWTKEREVFATPKKRPPKPGKVKSSELIKKYKVAEKMKGEKLGKEKLIEAYRGMLGGNRERSGREAVIRYVWGTARLTCFITISFSRDAPMKWSDEIQSLLDSVEMTGRHRPGRGR